MVALRKVFIVVLSLLLLSPLFFPTLSKEEGSLGHETNLLMPVAKALSGSMWLRLKGLDPVKGSEGYGRSSSEALQAGGPVLIPYREPSPKFSRNLVISYDVGIYPYQTEPHIAVNPMDGDKLVVGLIDYNFDGVVAYSSIDGGITWKGPVATKPPQGYYYNSDPVVGYNRSGEAYFAYLSVGSKYVRAGNIVLLAEIGSVAISSSSDGGRSWSEPTITAVGNAYSTLEEIVVTFLDKPWMAIGPDPVDPSRDNIYVTYTNFTSRYPVIEEYPYIAAPTIENSVGLVYSWDGGVTFSAPVALSPVSVYHSGEEEHRLFQGTMIAVGPDGILYVSYYDAQDDGPWEGLYAPTITRSTDGGQSFSKPVVIDYFFETAYVLPPTLFRAWSSMFPQIAAGPEGEVYMVFATNPPGPDDADIQFTRSVDRGNTWSRVERVNDDLTERDQFFPAITVDKNGSIHVIFGDKRDDTEDIQYHIYYTNSSDGGVTWARNARVTDYPSNPNYGIPYFIGDYFGIAASDDDINIVWCDTRLGRRSPNEAIAFARLGLIPSPSIYLSPPSGPAGTSVTVMGFNFAPYFREVYIELEGVIIASLLTDDDGRFTATLFMPISGEGTHTVRAMDILGNVAESSFYTEFGFNNIRDEFKENFDDIIEQLSALRESLGSINVTDVRPEINRLDASVESLVNKLDALEEKVNAETSGSTDLTWVTVALAILAIFIAAAILVTLLWRRGRP